MPAVGQDDARPAGTVADLLFSARGDRVVGLLLQGGSWWRRRLIPYEEVAAIGPAAVMLRRPVVLGAPDGPRLRRLRRTHAAIIGSRVLTRDGHDLGIVEDVCFEAGDGSVSGYLVSRGLVADLAEGKGFLPAERVWRASPPGTMVVDSSSGDPPEFLLTNPV